MRIVLLGPPGAGKGTIAAVLVKRTGALHIATGDLLREELKSNSELGAKARSYMEQGELVPDELVIAILEQRLDQPDAREGYILDGFPRTIAQAQRLDAFLAQKEMPLEAIFDLQVDENLIIERLSGRIICPDCGAVFNTVTLPPKEAGKCDRCGAALVQRKDDNPEAIKIRFQAYEKQTQPLLDYYRPRGLLYNIDAQKGAEKAADRILARLAALEPATKKG